MKKAKFLLFAGLVCLLAVGCHKDTGMTLDKFMMGNTNFKADDDSKVTLQYSSNRLLYEQNDVVKVNGETFTLSKSGEGSSTVWYANGNSISATEFYCAYADGVSTTLSSFSSNSYHFNLTDRLSSATNKVLMAGVTENNVLTLRPACAIIRVPLDNTSFANVKVGFEGGKVLKEGTISVDPSTKEVSISGSNHMRGVVDAAGTNAEFLMMEYNSSESCWYVAVPVSSTVTTKLFFYWEQNGSPVKYVTSGQVTLTKGYVYTVGSSRQSPFYANGSSKSYFQVSAGLQVRFSAGNLQYTRYEDPGTGEMTGKWRFAEHQYDMMQDNNENIGNYYTGWIDLFGWGTSGWNSGGGAAYEPYMTTGTFKPGGSNDADLLGTYANSDWGVYNSANIYYGSNPSGLTSWRTLTNDEWNYLLNSRSNAANKKGLATVGTAHGLVLLPESWTLPTGCSFTAGTGSGYSTNSYTLEQWDLMENAGAIFLPSSGYRNGTSVEDTPGYGYYWTATHNNGMYSMCVRFSSTSVENTTMTRSRGCAVRLVKNR